MTKPTTVVEASDATFQAEVLDASATQPVVVDFWAPWCGPCRVLSPVLDAVASEYEGRVRVVKVNVDENPQTARRYAVRSIPMVVGFRDGRPAGQFLGAQPEPQVRAFFEMLLPGPADRLVAEGRAALAAGDAETARARFEEALTHDADHAGAIAGLASERLAAGDLDGAEALAARIPGDPAVRPLLARARFLRVASGADREALEARLAADGDDAEAHYRLGCLLAAEERWEPALEHLLAAVERDRTLDDDGARKRMLDVFALLGNEHELTRESQRRLAMAIF